MASGRVNPDWKVTGAAHIWHHQSDIPSETGKWTVTRYSIHRFIDYICPELIPDEHQAGTSYCYRTIP